MMGPYPGMSMQPMGATCPTCAAPLVNGPVAGMAQWPWGYGLLAGQPGMGGFGPAGFQPGWMGTFAPPWGGMWTRGFASDDQIREMVYESIDADPSIPSDANISVDVTGGIVTLTGTVPNKRVKHAAGDDAWWIPDVVDVNNRLEIVGRRARAGATGATTSPGQRQLRTAGGR